MLVDLEICTRDNSLQNIFQLRTLRTLTLELLPAKAPFKAPEELDTSPLTRLNLWDCKASLALVLCAKLPQLRIFDIRRCIASEGLESIDSAGISSLAKSKDLAIEDSPSLQVPNLSALQNLGCLSIKGMEKFAWQLSFPGL